MGGRAGRAEIDREEQVADEGSGGRDEVSRRGGELGAAVGKQSDDTAGVVRVVVGSHACRAGLTASTVSTSTKTTPSDAVRRVSREGGLDREGGIDDNGLDG